MTGENVQEIIAAGLDSKNRFSVLSEEPAEVVGSIGGVTEEANEVVEVTVDSGASKSVWPFKKKEVARSKGGKSVRLAAANGSPIHVEGGATLQFVRAGWRCAMKFLDADVKRPLAAVCAIVDSGNDIVLSKLPSHS